MIAIIAFIIFRDYRNKIKTNKILDTQKGEIESLLLNILPADVAWNCNVMALQNPVSSIAFLCFSPISRVSPSSPMPLSPQEVVSELNSCFIAFDDIMEKYGLEKIKTIGDSYMCAGGFAPNDTTHPFRIVKASQEIQKFVEERNQNRNEKGLEPWEIRIGIHTGPVVAGVVGKKNMHMTSGAAR